MDKALEQILNLLLESERAGVVALNLLIDQAENPGLRRFLAAARDQESFHATRLEHLIRDAGVSPSTMMGPFAAKVAALDGLPDKLNLLSRGEEWVARKVEDALEIAPPSGPIHDFLLTMANRHRHEAEWGRAEVIRLLDADR